MRGQPPQRYSRRVVLSPQIIFHNGQINVIV
jgi:hypothetical protein